MARALLLALLGWGLSSPAAADVARDLRRFLDGFDAGIAPAVAGKTLNNPDLLSELYRARGHAPIWTGDGPLRAQVIDLIEAIVRSRAHGLNGEDYHLQTLTALDREAGADELALELLASDAFLHQARHRTTGAVAPRELDPEWHLIGDEVNAVTELRSVLDSGMPVDRALDALWPRSGEYRALVRARARILASGDLQMPRVAPGPLLGPGSRGPRVVALKERLLGPDDHSPLYDEALRRAVVEYQRAAGLETDGIVGEATLQALNVTRSSWIDTIDANLERWRWLPRRPPETYVRVNIARFALRVLHQGEEALRMDVIVGRPYRRTPVFTETIKYLVFNPYWNVPHEIAAQDKLPELRSDPAALAAQGYEARRSGADAFLPVTRFDWSEVQPGQFPYLLRQRPGPANALGSVKLMLPNPYAVYLHDTPGRELFSRQERSFSSGCIRLSRALDLARWVLDNDGQSDRALQVKEIVDSAETVTVHLRTPLPAYVVYFTAFTAESGEVMFRRDIYQRDARLVAALRDGFDP